MLCSHNNMSQKATGQLFFPTLATEWKGLSRVGLDILSKMGVGLAVKQFHTMKERLAMKERCASEEIIQERNPVVWFDNFSIYGNAFYRINAEPYCDSNYTAVALLDCPGDPYPLYVNRLPNGDVVPTCGPAVLSSESLSRCWQSYREYNNF